MSAVKRIFGLSLFSILRWIDSIRSSSPESLIADAAIVMVTHGTALMPTSIDVLGGLCPYRLLPRAGARRREPSVESLRVDACGDPQGPPFMQGPGLLPGTPPGPWNPPRTVPLQPPPKRVNEAPLAEKDNACVYGCEVVEVPQCVSMRIVKSGSDHELGAA